MCIHNMKEKVCPHTPSGILFVICTSQAVPSTKDPLWNKPRSQISASKFLCYLETFVYFFKLKFHMDDKDSQGVLLESLWLAPYQGRQGVGQAQCHDGNTGPGTRQHKWEIHLVAWAKALGDLKPWQEHTALDRCAVMSFAGGPHLQGQFLSWYFSLKRA